MRFRTIVVSAVAVGLLAAAGVFGWFVQAGNLVEADRISADAVVANESKPAKFGNLPIHFEQNIGQVGEDVKFLSRGAGYSLFLNRGEAVLALQKQTRKHNILKPEYLRMRLAGANTSPTITGENLLEGKTNYLIGNDPTKWKTEIASYERVRYSNVYDGIDVIYYGSGQKLEYDFVINPNADPNAIALKFGNAKQIKIDAAGELIVKMGNGTVRQAKPIAYQEIDGKRTEVAVAYKIQDSHSTLRNRKIGFEIGEYDHSRPLVIDPVLSYATYLGGSSDTFGTSIAVDPDGNAYVTGNTTAIDFPTIDPFQSTGNGLVNGFVTKINAAGTAFVYSTYISGNSNTFPSSIKVDASGSAYIGGWTLSSNFPTTAGAYRTLPPTGGGRPSFVTKLSPSGSSLSYSTYLGAVNDLTGLAIDSAGNAYLTGYTQDTAYPTTPGAYKTTLGNGILQNAYVTKLNATGSALVYSTFVGAAAPVTGATASDQANAIAVDTAGNAYITGITSSTNYPTTRGAFQIFPGFRHDAFVTKLNADGSGLVYSTYLGGSGQDRGTGIAVDSAGNAYVTGSFENDDFPFTADSFLPWGGGGFFGLAFLTKVNPTGTALVYSTALGYRSTMAGNGVAVDNTGSAYVIGNEGGGMGGYAINAIQSTSHSNDAFIVKMNPAGNGLTYASPFGGNGIANASSVGTAIALDGAGNAFITGYTTETDFPTTPGAAQMTKPGGGSASDFTAKIGVQPGDCPAITIGPQPPPTVILGQGYSEQLTATGGAAPYSFSLAPNFGNNVLPVGLTLATDGTISGTTNNAGTYPITVRVADANGCVGMRTVQLVVSAEPPQLTVRIVGRDAILRGRDNLYTFVYTNNSDADAFIVPLMVTIPNYSIWTPDFQVIEPVQLDGFPTIDYSLAPLDTPSDDNTLVSLLIPRISAHSTGQISIKVKIPDLPQYANIEFEMNAKIGQPLFDSSPAAVVPPNAPFRAGRTSKFNACQGDTLLKGHKGSVNRPDVSTACFQSLTDLLYDGIGLVPGANCATRVGAFGSGQGANMISSIVGSANGDSNAAGIMPGVLWGAGIVVAQCVLGESPLGRIAGGLIAAEHAYNSFELCVPDGHTARVRTVGSWDPNDKAGPSGAGAARYINGDDPLSYVIHFENQSTATAPAQGIVVTDHIDVSKFDLATFSFGDVTIGDMRLSPPPNRSTFSADFDLRPANNIIAHVSAQLDSVTGIITWNMQSIDPATRLPTDDPLAGILPPNTVSPRGEGSVMFNISAKSDLVTAAEILNRATIVFDTNPPIDTNDWLNTIDKTQPVSSAQALPQFSASTFSLLWSGTDVGAGIGSYDVFVSDNGGPFTAFRSGTAAVSAVFTGEIGHTYSFYSIAKDLVGNQEAAKTTAEATTTVDRASVPITVSGRVLTPDGRGINGATVIMFDSDNVQHRVRTNSFGNYRFDAVLTGQTYLLTASARRYVFENQNIQPTGDLANVNFVGIE